MAEPSSNSSKGAIARLMSEYKGLQKEPWVKITINEEQMFKWNMALLPLNNESYYYGAYLKVEMTFTHSYPYSPPTFKFVRPIHHPNIYPDGKVCISILHPPGDDEQSGEVAQERWSPMQGVESILRSVLLLLDDPEVNSPANVDASVLYRKDREAYKAKASQDVETSKQDIPDKFVMPTVLDVAPPARDFNDDDDDFWNQDAGSGSDELTGDDDDDEEGEQEFGESADEQEDGEEGMEEE